jgi:hypothetical protein
VPLAYVLCFEKHEGLVGIWRGLAIGYAVVTLVTGSAALRTDWDEMAKQAVARCAEQQDQDEEEGKQKQKHGLGLGPGEQP